jgi:Ca2+-transporting ATPase
MTQDPFAHSEVEVVQHLKSDGTLGLTHEQASDRLAQLEHNQLPETSPKKRSRLLAEQFADPIIYILVGAMVLALLFQDWAESSAIAVVVLITVAIGFFMELQAVRSLESLRRMGQTMANVIRSGEVCRVRDSLLVPGDILLLDVGDILTADARVLSQENLLVKESALTGESIDIEKKTGTVSQKTPLTGQTNMVFRGTVVTGGTGKAIVTATGKETQLGKIHQLALEATEERTPLEKKLNNLSKRLIILTLVMAILIMVAGYVQGKAFFLMLETALALAVATIPEGLPIVATIALAKGMVRLSKKQVIIKNLKAVETLGATNIICTDKTGTLTEDQLRVHTLSFDDQTIAGANRMSKAEMPVDHSAYQEIIMACMLCNDVALSSKNIKRDSIDQALIDFAGGLGYDPQKVQKKNEELKQLPFNTNRKLMATVNRGPDAIHTYAKGALEGILAHCDTILHVNTINPFHSKDDWLAKGDALASQGLRTIAFASKTTEMEPAMGSMLDQLTFLGIIGFIDPAREDVKHSIEVYKKAGIKVVMMTGDHMGTAKKIAQEIGLMTKEEAHRYVRHGQEIDFKPATGTSTSSALLETVVFARVVPEQKLKLIQFFQANNNVVAMIGDGINDIPALRQADIGIAMGIRGTEAAREAADMILKNDKFTAIELAIQQGRVIYYNIRQFVVYLLSSNLAEIVSVGIAALINLPSPLLPLQILFLNLITDIFPALALGLGKGNENLMRTPPRKPDEAILTPEHWYAILVYGLSISAAVLGITAFGYYILNIEPKAINNMAFYTLILAQLFNLFNISHRKESFIKNEVTTNLWVWLAIALCLFLTFLSATIPVVSEALSLTHLTLNQYSYIALFAFGSLLMAQFIKRIGNLFRTI